MIIDIPYNHSYISYEISSERVISNDISIKSHLTCDNQNLIVDNSLNNPIYSDYLEILSKNKKNITIIISDHTRPVPSKIIIPKLLDRIRLFNKYANITLLVATGCHRKTTKNELIDKLGLDIVSNEKIIIHDAFNLNDNEKVCTLPSGAELIANKTAVYSDLLLSEGFIEPHFFAGYSGGRKSVLPGICYKSTVYGNHNGEFIDSKFARAGNLQNNPINTDMESAARNLNLAFICNVVLDKYKKISAAFSGDPISAHHMGAEYVDISCGKSSVPADIVITSNGGFPLDQNLYQCVKGLSTAYSCVKNNGTIIICAGLTDGIGGDYFYSLLSSCNDVGQLYYKIKNTPYDLTEQDQWQVQILCKILLKCKVIVVSENVKLKEKIHNMKMEFATNLNDALHIAGDGTITVIPNGVDIFIKY